MLDLVAVAGQVKRMGAGVAALAQERVPRVMAALTAWEHAATMGSPLRDRVNAAKTSWLVAEPLEALGAYDVTRRTDYRVVASDGSQILPDRHEHLSCFLINTGIADIDYRVGTASLSSAPEVAWLPEDVYPLFGGSRQEADGRVVGARRFAAEADALRRAIETGPEGTVTLVDGTLLLWWLETDPERMRHLAPHDVKTQTFDALNAYLRAAKDHGALAASYLSSPRTRDVVSMLKVVLCTEDVVDCDRCPYDTGAKAWTAQLEIAGASMLPIPDKPCEEADPVSDAELYWSLLHEGQRSPRFRSHAGVCGAYDQPIDFFYLHVGSEVARVEFPAWVTPGALEDLAGTVLDQCVKGHGYPVAVQEAHEQAIVRGSDRRAFAELARRQNVSRPSAKLARKRVSVL